MTKSYDNVLLEISSNPSSEAIFATMSMQLKSEGGFERVLALLNSLVEDGKKQLHEAKKIWGATSSRCDVSTYKFHEKQDFYENRLNTLIQEVDESNTEVSNCSWMVQALGESQAWFQTFYDNEVSIHATEAALLNEILADSEAALDSVNEAIESVQNWTPASASFLQTSLKKITASYLQLHKFNIVVPSSFVQMAASDAAVKTRLLEWLNTLRVSFLDAQSSASDALASKQAIWTEIESQTQDLIATYVDDIEDFNDKQELFTENLTNLEGAVTIFQQLVDNNSQLVQSNSDYCDIEQTNFENAKDVLESQLALFKQIRDYFKTNYAKINQFVKDKYNSQQ
jgi:polyhydroxyalkanoate synthesis regulator phasin